MSSRDFWSGGGDDWQELGSRGEEREIDGGGEAGGAGAFKGGDGYCGVGGGGFCGGGGAGEAGDQARGADGGEKLLRPEVILASNTSSISVTTLAAMTKRPDKFVGMHFMNPVP